ncbi:MAG: ABC transporter permease [Eubacterium sp.]|nr:ABC transporter permease [Eubacterium sp.]
MKNPLYKRIPRELKHEPGKYIVIFLFMIIVIGFISGFLVSANSMITAFDEGFEKYNTEWGHFITKDEPGIAAIDSIAEDRNVDIDKLFYIEAETKGEKTTDPEGTQNTSNLRVYKTREKINIECLMEGSLPEDAGSIAVDRMYANNNHFSVGDEIKVGKEKLKISGLVAMPDYSALFENQSDMMFDAVKFGVGVVSEDCFEKFKNLKQNYCYAWEYKNAPADEDEEIDMAEEFMKTCVKYVSLEDYVPRYANQAINFTRVDFGGDSEMIKVILYVLMVVMAFVFAITIKHTITKEASVIGTLRASGYSKKEVLMHYMALPMLVTLVSAIIGNILGYTVFKDIAAAMYYGSYSLPTFVVLWNAEAFLLTTVAPIVIMFAINFFTISRSLKLSPLRFLRRDLAKKKKKKAARLPKFGFFMRFRLRIILQNRGNYIMLFVGIMLANVFLLFGMMMGPLLEHYQGEVLNTMPAKYQYILKTQVKTDFPKAEKFALTSTEYYPSGEKDGTEESISAYGIEKDSKYMTFKVPDEGVAISDGIRDKYDIDVGDELVLHEVYGKDEYKLKVASVVSYPSGLAVFTDREKFKEIFDPDSGIEDVMGDMEMLMRRVAEPQEYDYYNGYFSDVELTDIDDNYVQAKITETELTKVSRQLDVSMGELFQLWNVFSIILFVLLIYLLTKLVIEKNTVPISMVKILGYKTGEVASLYLNATTIVVVASLLATYLVATPVIIWLYHIFMMKMKGWLTIWIGWDTYVKMFFMGLLAYALVALLQFVKIRRIPMDEALKNVE